MVRLVSDTPEGFDAVPMASGDALVLAGVTRGLYDDGRFYSGGAMRSRPGIDDDDAGDTPAPAYFADAWVDP